MRCSTFLALIALTLTLFAHSPATAGLITTPITYTIDDYSGFGIQNNGTGLPVLISGTITTDGTIGTDIKNSAVILSWSLTFTQGPNSSINRAVNGATGKAVFLGTGAAIDISESSIKLHGADTGLALVVLGADVSTDWTDSSYINRPPSSDDPTAWGHITGMFGAPNFSPIAQVQTVPEPASLTLLGIGIAGMAGYAWRQRKKQAV